RGPAASSGIAPRPLRWYPLERDRVARVRLHVEVRRQSAVRAPERDDCPCGRGNVFVPRGARPERPGHEDVAPATHRQPTPCPGPRGVLGGAWRSGTWVWDTGNRSAGGSVVVRVGHHRTERSVGRGNVVVPGCGGPGHPTGEEASPPALPGPPAE